MESFSSSSWRSGSLTFVSPENHHHPAVCPSIENSQLQFPSVGSSWLPSWSSRKMAKILSVACIFLIIALVVGIVLADTVASNDKPSRAKLRAKSFSAHRKRKLFEASESVVETTTSPSLLDNPSYGQVEGTGSAEADVTSTTTARPKSRKVAKSVASDRSERPTRDNNVPTPTGCGECDLSTCKSYTEKSCQAGLVMDRCSCCNICGSGEGNRCYNASIPDLHLLDAGICGSGLACILRKDLDPNEPKEALCECRDRRLVCGSDNHTYSNECKLREAAYKNSALSIASWGPCVSAPWIPTSIENITVSDGEDASLSCEVKGFPSPIIHWEFLLHGSRGPPKILPGDDSSVVVTVRGGPEQTMSTSWIQIISVTAERQGTYYCVATNSHGAARNHATVLIATEPNARRGGS